jgi:CRISPR-associated protein Cas1
MLANGPGDPFAARWPGRQGRAASEPTNVALNFCYGLLLADTTRAILACGLDPHAGFVHSSARNKPALALDLMEQFRPVIADSVALGCINNGELRMAMFTDVLGATRLRDAGRRNLIAAYERRVQTHFRHPTYGYQVTWRRAMEIQARMLLGALDGTQESYVGIRTR